MTNADYFISDLHLSADEPALSALFRQFLDQHGTQMRALYILGDFFDAWIGDDDDSELADQVSAQLKSLSDQGVAIFLQHGNRDFLIGEAFACRCGAQMLGEFAQIHTAMGEVQLCHGDQFCTDDQAYQQFRALTRSAAWQQQFLSQSLAARRAFAAQARAQSKQHQQTQAQKEQLDSNLIGDVVEAEIMSFLSKIAKPKVVMIHGHTHRPKLHERELPDHRQAKRIVLGDWRIDQPSFLRISSQGVELNAHGWKHSFLL